MRARWYLLYSAIPFLAVVAPAGAAPVDPRALSDAVLIDFTFTLPENVTVQYFAGDNPVCEKFGDADCNIKVNQVNFGRMPEPPDFLYSIRHEYAAEAVAPPPDVSSAIFQLESIYHFTNDNDDDVFLPVNWTVVYNLFTEGVFSQASFSILYSTEGPDGQGVPDTLLFPPVSVSNGDTKTDDLHGTLMLQLFPGETKWLLEDPLTAAAAVPEPAMFPLFLCGIGLIARFSRRSRSKLAVGG